ncbi:MAG: hypothetical protein IMF09_06965 [Proteobacteria bacterium]|nr:hypothetical protein [Pseudomonadota bacterium]
MQKLLLPVLLIAPLAAQAGTDDSWEFKITPYLWAIGIDGITGPKGHEADIDMSFSDIFDKLDGAFIVSMEASKGAWTGWIDYTSMSLAHKAVADRVVVKAALDQKVTDMAVGYRLEGMETIELYAGGRFVDVNTVIKAEGQGPGGNVGKVSIGDDWIDPIVGVRGTWPLSEKWNIRANADIGGFGVGSDFAWQAAVAANYQFSERVSFLLAYRYLDMDYDDNGFVFDVVTSGPILGVSFSF